jgi:hypothetical protein
MKTKGVLGNRLQAILVPRDQNEVIPTAGKTISIGRTDAG